MSFVSFLKTFGLDVLRGVQIFEGIAPLATSALQAVAPKAASEIDKLTQMAATGLSIEANFAAAFGSKQKTGAAKLAALAAAMPQIVASSEVMVGKKVGDPALFTKAMQGYAQATADFLNSLQPNVATTNNQNLPPVAAGTTPVPPAAPPPTP